MHNNLQSLFFFTIVFFFCFRLSACIDDYRYSNCKNGFHCGHIKDIRYPFWGDNRPNYCGHPKFELKCQGHTTEMEILSHTYQVLSIDQEHGILRIARTDKWFGNCPAQFINTTLDLTLFNYTVSTTENLYLFYGCPSIPSLFYSKFRCSTNQTEATNYYVINSVPTNLYQNLTSCKISLVLPILEIAVGSFKSSEATVGAVLSQGFDVDIVTTYLSNIQCGNSGGVSGYDCTLLEPVCYCKHGSHPRWCITQKCRGQERGRAPRELEEFLALAFLAFGILVGLTIVVCLLQTKILSITTTACNKRTKNAQKVENFLKNHGSLAPKRYSYSNVKKMTSSFKHQLGQGGYGKVFKGKLLDGCPVAVKVLINCNGDGEAFVNEVASMTRTAHVNVVSLLGFCFEQSKRALVYEFMPNGSLEKFIYKKPSQKHPHLGRETLFQIAVGIARGLEYLHRGCNMRILHFDIKPHNILLNKDFCPKISDFGQAKLCNRKESSISIFSARGTHGYIAPEVFSRNFGGVSHKSDVYSYGMMVLEMVGGRKNTDMQVDHVSEIYYPRWIYKRLELEEDLGLHANTSEEGKLTRKMALVGLWCIQTVPSNRPSMSKVLEMLEGSLDSLKFPPNPFMCTPSRSPSHLFDM